MRLDLPFVSLRRPIRQVRNFTTNSQPHPPIISSIPTLSDSRQYTNRKTFLYAYYSYLFHRSNLVLLFAHDNLSVKDLQAIRKNIRSIPLTNSTSPVLLPNNQPQPHLSEEITSGGISNEKATLTISRTGVLSAVTRSLSLTSTRSHSSSLTSLLEGPTALITCPDLSPRYLSRLLLTIQRTIKSRNRDGVEEKKQPTLRLVAGVLEGRLMEVSRVEGVSKLGEMDQLRAELVGLLQMPGRQLVGVLGQAGGGGLVRTLQGLELSLKEKQGEMKV
ncbi:hypothetical protein TREMEDRAFT_68447 [Tremella mesenterica DSM 1558]|uniref:uncharacterized protein n=1 Tax=Tremella mesenterica (strain ATCC 24925 / CBS 8224 / DSM 1558 / NBRC 9311 / NRRL Y-6157 / RJB 2259-6 / UBC 559-6) TaxID=578456 RepID=UPI0003F49EE3|nr:uncharacterized protein TREMEDRAFT_68447 [Tremella mesenterica DSM 1558]EIW70040.1 hypothetical protein TREMEDRAFT_68447 [Tremella mesenterica DSM 1558]